MAISALTECQKAILWLMYFWQHQGFTQIARPATNTPASFLENARGGMDAEGRPIGELGFGFDVLLTDKGLMRTTWLWRYSTDATRLNSVDLPLIVVPLRSRFRVPDVLDAFRALVQRDHFIVEQTSNADSTKLRSVLIAPDVVLSVGVPVCLAYCDRHYAIPGLAYWISGAAAAVRQFAESEFEPWTVIAERTYQGSQESSLRVFHMAFVASQARADTPPPIEVLIPRGGVLVPLSKLRIRCGGCAATFTKPDVLFLDADACPKCQMDFELCGPNNGKFNEPKDMSLLADRSYELSDSGYRVARELVAGQGYSPFDPHSMHTKRSEGSDMKILFDLLDKLTAREIWEPGALPAEITVDVLRAFDHRGWIKLQAKALGIWISPQRDPGTAGTLDRMVRDGCLIRVSEEGKDALAEYRVLSAAHSSPTAAAATHTDNLVICHKTRRAIYHDSLIDIDNGSQFDLLAHLDGASHAECSYTDLERVRNPAGISSQVEFQSAPSELAKCVFRINQALKKAGVPWKYGSIPRRKAYARQERRT